MTQATPPIPSGRSRVGRRGILLLATVALAAAGLYVHHRFGDTWKSWLPGGGSTASSADAAHDHAGHDHASHGHDHADDANLLELSEQARKNIGLRLARVELGVFTRTIEVPGMIAARPGRSTLLVTAPLTGTLVKVHVIEGEAIEPVRRLFDLRLTHEELVQSQAELLQTVEELDVTSREIARVERITESGGLAGKQLLERQYERQKLEALLRSKREALLLHGLSAAQIDEILKSRRLLQELTVTAPARDAAPGVGGAPLQVASLKVAPGQHVNAGDTLAELADHAELYVQGEAFERDVETIARAAESQADVTAVREIENGRFESIPGLRILYLASQVDPHSRTLAFFVTLPNQVERDAKLPDGRRFFAWRFRPGQRVELRIPVETLDERIVLPVDAIAQDGAETYVFTPNGDHLERRPVHVEHRDAQHAVLAHDGSLFPGESVAVAGARQLLLAFKNKAGGAIDPHAGHQH